MYSVFEGLKLKFIGFVENEVLLWYLWKSTTHMSQFVPVLIFISSLSQIEFSFNLISESVSVCKFISFPLKIFFLLFSYVLHVRPSVYSFFSFFNPKLTWIIINLYILPHRGKKILLDQSADTALEKTVYFENYKKNINMICG